MAAGFIMALLPFISGNPGQEFLYRPPVFQDDGLRVVGFVQPPVVPLPVVFVIVPDPADEFPVEPLRAAGSHIRPGAAVVGCDPTHHSPQAGAPGEVQIDDRVAFCQAHLHGAAVIAVENPCGGFQNLRQPGVKFLPGYAFPARAPIELIQVDYGDAGDGSQLPGQGGFSAAGAADNQNSPHGISSF